MSSINIPEEGIESLYSFSQLNEDVKNGIYKILAEIKLGDHPKRLSKIISEEYSVDYEEIYGILSFYFTLLKAIHQTKKADDEVVSEVVESIESTFDFEVEDLKSMENAIESFIKIRNEIPLITSLAFDVALSANNLFLKSFIYEDLRPVFFNDKISGLALYHTIRLHFRKEDTSHSDLYLTIDKEDIEDLIDQLTIAKNRTSIIKEQYGDSVIEI